MPLREYCPDCESAAFTHLFSWADSIFSSVTPSFWFARKFENFFESLFLKTLSLLGIATLSSSFRLDELSPRVALFIEAAQKRGISCAVLKVGNRYTEHIALEHKGSRYFFEGYPTAAEFDGPFSKYAADKEKTKRHLLRGNFPAPRGKAYFFWQKRRAFEESIRDIGFPLVVKPARGTFSRHVSTNIRSEEELKSAINKVLAYQPRFIVERYIDRGTVHRFTVIDFQVEAAAREERAHVIGDGRSNIRELIKKKNAGRAQTIAGHSLYPPIPFDMVTNASDAESGFQIESIPPLGMRVYVQQDPFLRLGADFIDETDRVLPQNRAMIEKIVRHFEIHVAGVDAILEDVTIPFDQQSFAILEINNLPSIEMHHEPSYGESQDVANALLKLFQKDM